MSSQAASHAKTSALQENERALRASAVDSGQSAPVLLGSFSPDTPSLKTSQTCLMENGEIGLSEFSGTFPRSGMMRSGTVYQLPNLARTTTEIGSGLWPTPDVRGFTNKGSLQGLAKKAQTWEEFSAMAYRSSKKTKRPFWPTPTAMTGGEGIAPSHVNGSHGWSLGAAAKDSLSQEPMRMWPTPSTRDYKGGYIGGRMRNGKVSRDTLDVAVQHTDNQEKTNGTLNPTWVEWLMGFPIGHTDLNV
tara:strand:- start:126 stop:863 length:738 start_codon:yes stop_codon:yes gene_type:complete